eukprot:Rmarinus@m.27502
MLAGGSLGDKLATQHFHVADSGVLFRNPSKDVSVVPSDLRPVAISLCHDDMGHFGVQKTYSMAARRFWFDGMFGLVEQYVKSCKVCQSRKPSSVVARGAHGLQAIVSNRPMELVACDLMGPFSPVTEQGSRYIMVVGDPFTKFIWIIPMCTKTADETVGKLVREVFCMVGAPDRLLTDRGMNFLANDMEALLSDWGVRKVNTSSYHTRRQTGLLREQIVPYKIGWRCGVITW